MSGDVSLAQPARTVAHSTIGPWELLFAGSVVGATVLAVAGERDATPGWRVGVVVVAAAMGAWYVVIGRRAARCSGVGVRAYVTVAGLVALFIAALALTPTASYMLLGLPGVIHVLLTEWQARTVVVLCCALPSAVFIAQTHDVDHALRMVVPIGVAAALFSALIATVIARIERRSSERAELIRELEASRGEVARLSRAAGVAEERTRLAGEIHDTVAQGLSSVVMLVQAADAALATDQTVARAHLTLAAATARDNLAETRAIVAALTPTPLADASLPHALLRLGERFGVETAIAVDVEIAGDPRPLPTAVEVVLLRVAQEGLTNTRKHAAAHRASVRLLFKAETVVLEVRDDGCGFDPDTATGGYGLPTMRGRLDQLGGTLTVHSEPGTGSVLHAEVAA